MPTIESFPGSFQPSVKTPLDERMVVDDISAASQTFLDTAFEGLIVFDKATSRHLKINASDGTQIGLSFSPLAPSTVENGIKQNRPPTATDDSDSPLGISSGVLWLDESTNFLYYCVSDAVGLAEWKKYVTEDELPAYTDLEYGELCIPMSRYGDIDTSEFYEVPVSGKYDVFVEGSANTEYETLTLEILVNDVVREISIFNMEPRTTVGFNTKKTLDLVAGDIVKQRFSINSFRPIRLTLLENDGNIAGTSNLTHMTYYSDNLFAVDPSGDKVYTRSFTDPQWTEVPNSGTGWTSPTDIAADADGNLYLRTNEGLMTKNILEVAWTEVTDVPVDVQGYFFVYCYGTRLYLATIDLQTIWYKELTTGTWFNYYDGITSRMPNHSYATFSVTETHVVGTAFDGKIHALRFSNDTYTLLTGLPDAPTITSTPIAQPNGQNNSIFVMAMDKFYIVDMTNLVWYDINPAINPSPISSPGATTYNKDGLIFTGNNSTALYELNVYHIGKTIMSIERKVRGLYTPVAAGFFNASPEGSILSGLENPTPLLDRSNVGISAGVTYVNETTGENFICKDDTIGSAVWRKKVTEEDFVRLAETAPISLHRDSPDMIVSQTGFYKFVTSVTGHNLPEFPCGLFISNDIAIALPVLEMAGGVPVTKEFTSRVYLQAGDALKIRLPPTGEITHLTMQGSRMEDGLYVPERQFKYGIIADRPPTQFDDFDSNDFDVDTFQTWYDRANKDIYVCLSATPNAAQWRKIPLNEQSYFDSIVYPDYDLNNESISDLAITTPITGDYQLNASFNATFRGTMNVKVMKGSTEIFSENISNYEDGFYNKFFDASLLTDDEVKLVIDSSSIESAKRLLYTYYPNTSPTSQINAAYISTMSASKNLTGNNLFIYNAQARHAILVSSTDETVIGQAIDFSSALTSPSYADIGSTIVAMSPSQNRVAMWTGSAIQDITHDIALDYNSSSIVSIGSRIYINNPISGEVVFNTMPQTNWYPQPVVPFTTPAFLGKNDSEERIYVCCSDLKKVWYMAAAGGPWYEMTTLSNAVGNPGPMGGNNGKFAIYDRQAKDIVVYYEATDTIERLSAAPSGGWSSVTGVTVNMEGDVLVSSSSGVQNVHRLGNNTIDTIGLTLRSKTSTVDDSNLGSADNRDWMDKPADNALTENNAGLNGLVIVDDVNFALEKAKLRKGLIYNILYTASTPVTAALGDCRILDHDGNPKSQQKLYLDLYQIVRVTVVSDDGDIVAAYP